MFCGHWMMGFLNPTSVSYKSRPSSSDMRRSDPPSKHSRDPPWNRGCLIPRMMGWEGCTGTHRVILLQHWGHELWLLWWLISCEAMLPVGPIAKCVQLVLIARRQLGVLGLGGSYSRNIPWAIACRASQDRREALQFQGYCNLPFIREGLCDTYAPDSS